MNKRNTFGLVGEVDSDTLWATMVAGVITSQILYLFLPPLLWWIAGVGLAGAGVIGGLTSLVISRRQDD